MDDRTIVSSNEAQGSQIMPLAKQESSLFHLTLNEFQNQFMRNIGKPLNNMNFDEFVRVVISFEEMQFLQNPSSSSFPSSPCLDNFHLNNEDLRKKTIGDIWNEIHHQQEQLTLEEMRLEEVRAGIVTNNIRHQNHVMCSNSIEAQPTDPMPVLVSQQEDWFQFRIEQQQQQQQQQGMFTTTTTTTTLDSNNYHDNNQVVSEQVFDNSASDVSNYSENHQLVMSMPNRVMSASSSSNSKSVAEKRKRNSDDVMNKTIERRQKRMIKNRESAARSRAKKQAYTNQLEQQVVHLKELNGCLKKQKEVNILLSSEETSMPKYQLRRTSSSLY